MSELLKLIRICGQLGKVISAVAADGKVDLRDLSELKDAFVVISSIATIDWKALEEEITDLEDLVTNKEKCKELAEAFRVNFDLKNDTVEGLIEDGVEILLNAVTFIFQFIKRPTRKLQEVVLP